MSMCKNRTIYATCMGCGHWRSQEAVSLKLYKLNAKYCSVSVGYENKVINKLRFMYEFIAIGSETKMVFSHRKLGG